MKTYTIKTNEIQCNRCGDKIKSLYRHDFKWCSCGDVFVDGGLSYLRRGTNEEGSFTELSVMAEEENNEC